MDTLAKLFGSTTLVKVMRLFLFHPEDPFDIRDVSKRAHISPDAARWAVNLLKGIGFIKARSFMKERERGQKRSRATRRVRVPGWAQNATFPYREALHVLLIESRLLAPSEIERKLKRAGNLKLVIASGIFVNGSTSAIDLLIVGDRLQKRSVESAVRLIESAIGAEIRYAAFETAEFKYRLAMYDKLIRDVLDYKHIRVLNKLGL